MGRAAAVGMMKAVVTNGIGGLEQLDFRDVPIPTLSPGEVLVQVLAAGVNNTDINTRLGWYSSAVGSTADELAADEEKQAEVRVQADGGWQGSSPFPLIQGTDCCGRVQAVADTADNDLLGARVLIRPCTRSHGWDSPETRWMASDFDGAFAQFVRVTSDEVFRIQCDWTDAELGTIPCCYGTAENMLDRANVGAGDRVFVTGASGGVGSAVVQLCKRRQAVVIAMTDKKKSGLVRDVGADQVVTRDDDPVDILGEQSVRVVVDNVAGKNFGRLLQLLQLGGSYVTSGAIAGPIVSLDMRELYLKDLTLLGSTAWGEKVFPNIISYIEKGEIKPLVAGSFPLSQIAEVQQRFATKTHVGKYVLIPPEIDESQQQYLAGVRGS